jgi:O-antigen ligase
LLALGVTALLFTNVIYDNVNDILNRREASVESRQQIYDYVLSHVHEVLPFGIGVNGLYDRTHGILSRDGFSHAHNAWLSFLVAGGIIGGLCFIALTILALVKSIQHRDLKQFVPMITVVVLCIAESPTYAGSNWTIISVATVSVLVLVLPLTSSRHDNPLTVPPFRPRPAKAVEGMK